MLSGSDDSSKGKAATGILAALSIAASIFGFGAFAALNTAKDRKVETVQDIEKEIGQLQNKLEKLKEPSPIRRFLQFSLASYAAAPVTALGIIGAAAVGGKVVERGLLASDDQENAKEKGQAYQTALLEQTLHNLDAPERAAKRNNIPEKISNRGYIAAAVTALPIIIASWVGGDKLFTKWREDKAKKVEGRLDELRQRLAQIQGTQMKQESHPMPAKESGLAMEETPAKTNHTAQTKPASGKEDVLGKGASGSHVNFTQNQPKPEGVTLNG